MGKFLACIVLVLWLFVWGVNYVNAESIISFPDASGGQINEAIAKTTNVRLLPSNPFYSIISVKEVIGRFFQPSSSRRAGYDFILTSKRLKETYLLLDKNDTKKVNSALVRYSGRIDRMLVQIEKARAQNQNIEPIINEITNGFGYHEVLFYAISKKLNDNGNSNDSYKAASLSFMEAIDAIDLFRPGFRNRFRSAINFTIYKAKLAEPSPTPNLPGNPETTPSANPKRIIY